MSSDNEGNSEHNNLQRTRDLLAGISNRATERTERALDRMTWEEDATNAETETETTAARQPLPTSRAAPNEAVETFQRIQRAYEPLGNALEAQLRTAMSEQADMRSVFRVHLPAIQTHAERMQAQLRADQLLNEMSNTAPERNFSLDERDERRNARREARRESRRRRRSRSRSREESILRRRRRASAVVESLRELLQVPTSSTLGESSTASASEQDAATPRSQTERQNQTDGEATTTSPTANAARGRAEAVRGRAEAVRDRAAAVRDRAAAVRDRAAATAAAGTNETTNHTNDENNNNNNNNNTGNGNDSATNNNATSTRRSGNAFPGFMNRLQDVLLRNEEETNANGADGQGGSNNADGSVSDPLLNSIRSQGNALINSLLAQRNMIETIGRDLERSRGELQVLQQQQQEQNGREETNRSEGLPQPNRAEETNTTTTSNNNNNSNNSNNRNRGENNEDDSDDDSIGIDSLTTRGMGFDIGSLIDRDRILDNLMRRSVGALREMEGITSSTSNATDLKCPVCNEVFVDYEASDHPNAPGRTTKCSHGALSLFTKLAHCPICFEENIEPPNVVALACGHVVCKEDFVKLGGHVGSDEKRPLGCPRAKPWRPPGSPRL